MDEIVVISTANTTWNCANCGCYMLGEPSQVWDGKKEITIYTPVSRYWAPGSKPNTSKAVYCRAECAQSTLRGMPGPTGDSQTPEPYIAPKADDKVDAPDYVPED